MSTSNTISGPPQSQILPPQDWTELRHCLVLYKQLGLRVIPMKHGEKTTYLKHWKPYQQQAPRVDEEAEWFHKGKESNVGIICGEASQSLVALCFNTQDGAETFFGDNWEQVRKQTIVVGTKRGPHVYLRSSDKPIKSEIIAKGDVGSWLEIRSDGNYIIAPPSLHPSGIKYSFLSECRTIMKVAGLENLISKRLNELGISREKEARVKEGENWVTEALKGVPYGVRDVTCTRLAGYFKNSLPIDVTMPILKDWAKRCEQLPIAPTAFTDSDVEKCVRSVYRYGEPIKEEPEEQITLPPTPDLPEDVWQRLFRDYQELVADTTEASDNYHFACFTQLIGTTLARRVHIYHARQLFPNFYICLVGRTAVTRKDTSWSRARDILERLHTDIDVENPVFQIIPGIGSAEGLIDALGGEKKVVLLNESEFLSLLSKARQEGLSNLIPKLTSLYDCPDRETLKTRIKAVECKEPFLSIISGTTHAWLQQALTEREIYGGFANRFMFVCGEPKSPLPFPPKVDAAKRDALVSRINDIRLWADELRADNGGELAVSDEAKARFAVYYADYHTRCASESLSAALIPRVQTFVWKLALLYAAMDFSQVIKTNHLEPAILAGSFLEQSAMLLFHAFGASRGKQVEEKLLAFLRSRGKGNPISQREVYRTLNLSATELEQAAKPLQKLGLIRNSTKVTEKGRKVLCYEAL